MKKDVTNKTDRTVFVTIGRFQDSEESKVFLYKHIVTIDEWPDTILDSTLNLRHEMSLSIGMKAEDLYFEVYRHKYEPYEKPFLYSNNSPAEYENLLKLKKSKESDPFWFKKMWSELIRRVNNE